MSVCRNGHERTPQTTRVRPDGRLECRVCRLKSKAKFYSIHGSDHWGSRTPRGRTLMTWHNMKSRCLDPKNRGYRWYGARGIKICERWLTFENFLSDMGFRPEGLSLDRINSNGDYEPSNCRWVTQKQQLRNTRRNRMVEIDGQSKCIAEWAEIYSLPRRTIRSRWERGLSGSDLVRQKGTP